MKRTFKCILTASLLATSSLSYGTVFFQNNGTLSGWGTSSSNPLHGDNKGTVSQVSSPSWNNDGAALKATQIYDATYSANSGFTKGYHAEVVQFGVASRGRDLYFGQAIMLPTSWLDHDSNDTFMQVSPENPSGAWSLTHIFGNHIRVGNAPGKFDLGGISKGVWTRVICRYKFGNPGTYEAWVNGVKTVSQSNVNCDPNGSASIRWSNGIYCTAWRNHKLTDPDANIYFNQTTRTIYHDKFRIASSPGEADPIHW